MDILSSHYWGNIEYFAHIIKGDFVIDAHEHYRKQSYRNRMVIATSGGALSLSVPIIKVSGTKQTMASVNIEYATKWQKDHWRAIVSAYRNSPYFDHYEDMVAPLYHQPYESLIEFNTQTTKLALEMMGKQIPISLSSQYVEPCQGNDLRDAISPKINSSFRHEEYYQVFSDVVPFVANLSIFDLIMCEGGRGAYQILENSIWENYQREE